MYSLSTRLGVAALALSPLFSMAATAGEKPVVLILTSDSAPRTAEILRTFKAETTFAVRMSYDLGSAEDPSQFIANNLAEFDPAMVVTLGDLALTAAAREWASVPLLAIEADPGLVGRLGHPQVLEVGGQVAPQPLFEAFAELLPGSKEVGMVRLAQDASPRWEALQAASEAAGLDLVVETIARPEELPVAHKRLLSRVDLVVAHEDPAVWSPGLLLDALDEAERARVPLATWSTSHFEAQHRPALVVTTGAEGLAHEAARLCSEVVESGKAVTEVASASPAPVLVGHREALLRARVPLTKKTKAAIDVWADAHVGEEETP